jgi:hypothetical protein
VKRKLRLQKVLKDWFLRQDGQAWNEVVGAGRTVSGPTAGTSKDPALWPMF